jgi:uroporphyrinogen decarboxylase
MTSRLNTLSHRERVQLALDHQTTDRIPIALVCAGINAPALHALETHLRQTRGIPVDAYLEPLIDIREVAPPYLGPALAADEDIWGVRRAPVSYGADSYDEIVFYPLANAVDPGDLEAHRWPQPDWFDYEALAAAAAADEQYCLMVTNGNIFERSWYMRGLEQMFMNFVLNPELAHAILERVTTFFCAYFDRMLAACRGRIDLAFTADDIGGQNGLLLSLPMWETFIKPYHMRLNAVIHRHGARVIYHTDGAVMPAVPGLIDMGIDVLQALQFSAKGMDPVALKQQYGDRLCFEGGICVQQTLPFGTPAEVQNEVQARIDVLGVNGGYILGPSHYIQANTPPENITALFDTAAAYYPYR